MTDKDEPATKKKSSAKKAPVKKTAHKAKQENVTVEDMHKLLEILHVGLASRDKAMDYLVMEIRLNREQIEQNKKILAKRGFYIKLTLVIMALGIIALSYDQQSIIRVFEHDMTNVSENMDVMVRDMSAMRQAMESMSADMHSMSTDFSNVSRGVSSIDNSVISITHDVRSMAHGVRGMSYDTHQMNRNMDDMVPPFSPW